jgi:hypothetical protein
MASHDFPVSFLARDVVPGFKGIGKSFALGVIVIFPKVDISDVPKIVGSPASQKAFGGGFDANGNVCFGVDCFAGAFDAVGEGFLASDSFDVLAR